MSTKITELTAASSLVTSDIVPVVEVSGPTTKKATLAVVRAALMPAVLTADVSGVLPVANGGTGVAGASVTPAAMAIDWTAAAVFAKTLAAGANTFTFSNASDGMCIIVVVTGAASTLTWPTVKWAAGAAPTQSASGIDVYTFVKVGSTIYGSVVQAMA